MSLKSTQELLTKTSLTIEDVLSLLIQGVSSVDDLQTIYRGYEEDIDLQTEMDWPKLVLRNDQDKELFIVHKYRSSFVTTTNPLTLIHNLLYTEQLKKECQQDRGYENVLDRVIVKEADITEYSVNDLVRYVKVAMIQYLRIYEKGSIEYQLGSDILLHL